MIELTPIEESVADKQFIQMGVEKGMEIGELIGGIRMAQGFLPKPVAPREALAEEAPEALRAILDGLEAELG